MQRYLTTWAHALLNPCGCVQVQHNICWLDCRPRRPVADYPALTFLSAFHRSTPSASASRELFFSSSRTSHDPLALIDRRSRRAGGHLHIFL
ncbi:hypothetical protein K461DRAFT_150570 [Myriangium duriaei CBS 260.36]|uniref:Uncharacterized protein n=1 Tax=Myriangium duriaei CBS 260.36 TaxID=1168546 RepID=A0A9P4J202_9PEZI|nr:hypothetical protein K461DRAFT_150570 [Myriangium duriaei CBS 260.36]